MMTYRNAIRIFNEEFPELIVSKCVDYDADHFVVEALENLNAANYNSPYYGIDKMTGDITSFIPSLDLDAFFEAIENRTVYSTY